jgi:hypothetical protein
VFSKVLNYIRSAKYRGREKGWGGETEIERVENRISGWKETNFILLFVGMSKYF